MSVIATTMTSITTKPNVGTALLSSKLTERGVVFFDVCWHCWRMILKKWYIEMTMRGGSAVVAWFIFFFYQEKSSVAIVVSKVQPN